MKPPLPVASSPIHRGEATVCGCESFPPWTCLPLESSSTESNFAKDVQFFELKGVPGDCVVGEEARKDCLYRVPTSQVRALNRANDSGVGEQGRKGGGVAFAVETIE